MGQNGLSKETVSAHGAQYQEFMDELSLRLSALLDKLVQVHSSDSELQKQFLLEACYLQTRMICELVAVASLSLHDPDSYQTHLQKTSYADKIFVILQHVNSVCFPRSVTVDFEATPILVTPHARQICNIEAIKKIYRSCGEKLHQRSLRRRSNAPAKDDDLTVLYEYHRLFVLHFTTHMVAIPSEKTAFIAMLGKDCAQVISVGGNG